MRSILHSQAADAGRNVLAHVAGNLRRTRHGLGWSQERLAAEAGLSRRMIAAVESGGANISLSNLDRLAAAMSVKFTDLVRPPDAPDARRIESLAWQGERPGSRAVLLGAAPAKRETELWSWTLAPGERYASEEHSENWHEMLFVVAGTLTLELPDVRRTLAVGDFMIFRSAEPYSFANDGSTVLHYLRNVVL